MTPRDTSRRLYSINGGQPTTMKDALSAGITRSSIRAALQAGHLRSLGHGVIALPTAPTDTAEDIHRERMHAIAGTHRDIVFSHDSAALILGIPSRGSLPMTVHAYHCAPRQAYGLFRHRGRLDSAEIVQRDGLMVTSPWRTACDLARMDRVPFGLMALDHVLRQRTLAHASRPDLPDDRAVEIDAAVAAARAELAAYVHSAKRRHGVGRLRLAAELASPLAESPAESYSRGEFLEAGLPIERLQVRVVDADGVERRLDMLLADNLAGECDGLVKYDDPDPRSVVDQEKRRDLALAAVGIDTVRWSASQMFSDPDSVVTAVRKRLRRGTFRVSR